MDERASVRQGLSEGAPRRIRARHGALATGVRCGGLLHSENHGGPAHAGVHEAPGRRYGAFARGQGYDCSQPRASAVAAAPRPYRVRRLLARRYYRAQARVAHAPRALAEQASGGPADKTFGGCWQMGSACQVRTAAATFCRWTRKSETSGLSRARNASSACSRPHCARVLVNHADLRRRRRRSRKPPAQLL